MTAAIDSSTTQLIFLGEQTSCFYEFELRTSLACHTHSQECVDIDEETGLIFDLSALTLTGSNWKVVGTALDVEINVCAALIRNTAAQLRCDEDAGACIVNG